jgi:(S)-mandelate dehydrogenase
LDECWAEIRYARTSDKCERGVDLLTQNPENVGDPFFALRGEAIESRATEFAVPFRYSLKSVLDGAMHPRWLVRQLSNGLPELANFAGADTKDVSAQAALMNRQMDASFAWDDLKALRDAWPHTLLVKGLLRAEEAKQCIQLGVDGVVISNHGARQLEDTAAPVQKITEFCAEVDRPILVDSGFRRGADVVKAVARLARAQYCCPW